MNTLEITITQSEESNDHQVLVKVDNKNIIEWFLWIDPVVFFQQDTFLKDWKLIIWRCWCWEVWCGSKVVEVKIDNDIVCWDIKWIEKYSFNKEEYTKYLQEKENDKSWEDLNRRVERLVWIEFNNTIYKNKYFFDWASCRIREEDNQIFLSYSLKNPKEWEMQQQMLSFPWNRIDEEDAIKNAKIFKLENNDIG